MKKLSILQVPISTISKKDIKGLLKKVIVSKSETLFIATVNPSFIVKAQKNPDFLNILQSKTGLNVADGVGVQLAAEFSSNNGYNSAFLSKLFKGVSVGFAHTIFKKPFTVIPSKITGVEITQLILDLSAVSKKTVLIILKQNGLTPVKKINSYLRQKYPNLNYTIIELGVKNLPKYSKLQHYDVLLCGLGEIYQEVLINSALDLIKPKVAIGIGGTFDVLTSNSLSKDKLSQYGLSWLSRLLYNPKRIGKILTSVIVFPILVFKNSLHS